jgi:hypothetical protein
MGVVDMKRPSRDEYDHAADTLFQSLRDMEFLASLDDATLQGQARWAVSHGLDRLAFLRVVYFLGCQALYTYDERTLGMVSAITGSPMSAYGWHDDLPF